MRDPLLMLLVISLVLALGEILDTPFRALDEFDNFLEFDVFLDREVIDILVSEYPQVMKGIYYHKQ